MSLPSVWPRLPGAADFLDTILDDLSDHASVLIGLPNDVPNDLFAIEMAEQVKFRSVGNWDTVRADEACSVAPKDSIERRFGDSNAARFVLWVDADSDGSVEAWIQHLLQMNNDQMPRVCVPISDQQQLYLERGKTLRKRNWRDFVTPLDSRVLVQRVARREGHKQQHIKLKSALVSEIAGIDLMQAERLASWPISKLLDVGQHNEAKIWAAQLSVLLPLIERERQKLLDEFAVDWSLPHNRKDGTIIFKLYELEIGDMTHQAQYIDQLEPAIRRLNWLREVRNLIAHHQIVGWDLLTSPVGIEIQDFR